MGLSPYRHELNRVLRPYAFVTESCEYVTKGLCEKSLHKRRRVSHPDYLALNSDAPKRGVPASFGVRPNIGNPKGKDNYEQRNT